MIDFLNSIIDLLDAFLFVPFLNYWFFPMIALCFLATVPAIIRYMITWR